VANPLFLTSQFVAAGLFFLIALVLVFVRCPSKANRPFAAYLVVQAGILLANGMSRIDARPDFWIAVYGDLQLLVVPVLLYFVLQYIRPLPAPWLTVASVGVLVAAVAIQVIAFLAPCLHLCATSAGGMTTGPLFLLDSAGSLWLAGVALWLMVASRGFRPAKRTAIALVASSVALVALLDGILAFDVIRLYGWGNPAMGLEGAWATVAPPLRLVAVLPALASLALLIQAGGSLEERARRGIITGIAVLGVLLSALVIIWDQKEGLAATLGYFVANLWSVLAAGVVAFALLRHRLFGLDAAVKFTVSRSTIAAAFVALFLIVSKLGETVAQSAFQGQGPLWGTLMGAVAAGLLLFALRPLERMGEKVAETVLPGDRPGKRRSGGPASLKHYREQVELVWSDGIMGLRERTLLEDLRNRLGISPEDALRIEHETAQSHGRPAGRPGRQPV
jgi:hypothetical protein